MENDYGIIEVASLMADKINKLNLNGESIILDSFAELTVNGVEYQVQVQLEPRLNMWTKEDVSLTIRNIVD